MTELQQKPIQELLDKSAQLQKRIGLPEASDPRVLTAAAELSDKNICKPVLIGDEGEIRKAASAAGISLPAAVEIAQPEGSEHLSVFADQLFERRRHKGMTEAVAADTVRQPLWFANFMLDAGLTDGTLAGSVHTTGDVIRSALQTVGVREKGGMLSSCFLMILQDGRQLTYADCGVIPYPDSPTLAGIAADAAASHLKLSGEAAKVAMLSFSTKGSAKHERVALVTEALQMVREKHPELLIDGELQFDAAYVAEIGLRKAPDSPLKGAANVFIFPNLDAGNIAYKITERIGCAVALGPILQGLSKPVNDLSRGCSASDIVLMSAITSLLSEV
ncbi:phosphate acetyltransferase [Cyclonatronum proteinivorum]|uniref:Phosphate acetyltransferase n=1 Tax=Cyclonatronum proteinivorum TaxID=1457365 RepID=A0A345UK42_9BACT|nr:phosphate acetyltransferase [Cyclonatronum proteinivorum]AXJ00844.1 phosphate acetyltransferase [Cyclonatronum proteinivorum]